MLTACGFGNSRETVQPGSPLGGNRKIKVYSGGHVLTKLFASLLFNGVIPEVFGSNTLPRYKRWVHVSIKVMKLLSFIGPLRRTAS